jgi:hypothetical protein
MWIDCMSVTVEWIETAALGYTGQDVFPVEEGLPRRMPSTRQPDEWHSMDWGAIYTVDRMPFMC